MIITVTPNTGLDYTMSVDAIKLDTTMRAQACAWGLGGKAIDAAWILGKLGEPSLALGFVAGPNGLRLEGMLHARGVETDFVWVDGDTRLNIVIVDNDSMQTTFTSPSLRVSPQHLLEFETRYRQALEIASCLVIGGSLPQGVGPEFYLDTIYAARQRGIPVIFDACETALVEGLKARPTLIKPNLAELSALVGRKLVKQPEIRQAISKVCREYGLDMVLTLGKDGAIACLSGNMLFIAPLSVNLASAAGAGDGVLAGLALAIDRHEPVEKGLVYGFALAGAIVQTLSTADFNLQDYHDLLNQVSVTAL